MSVLIKGMKTPKNCFNCPFMYGRKYCLINSKIEFNDADYSELKRRYDDCPLVPANLAFMQCGYWEDVTQNRHDSPLVKCSVCGEHYWQYFNKFSFCPTCGAKMIKKEVKK